MTCIVGAIWREEEKQRLRDLWPLSLSAAELIPSFPGRSRCSIIAKASKMGLEAGPRRTSAGFVRFRHAIPVPKKAWIAAATQSAQEASVSPVCVMAGVKDMKHVLPRWRAWRSLVASGYTIPQIAKVSGFDNSSVRHGVLSVPLALEG